MKLLAVESSSVCASAALLVDGKILLESFINNGYTHSQNLLPLILHTLQETETPIGEINGFAVGAGPGSFTGLRIGVAAVKGLAQPGNRPCIGVSTLEALAYQFEGREGILCPVLDARRGYVYNAVFESCRGKPKRMTGDRVILISDLLQELHNLKKPVYLIGDGAALCYNSGREGILDFKVFEGDAGYQRASGVGIAAWRKWQENQFVTPQELSVHYIQMPQAERELRSRLGGDCPMIYLGCDHAAVELEEAIYRHLKLRGAEVEKASKGEGDFDDYPDAAAEISRKVTGNPGDIGILCCGTGIGMSIAANKIKGIRAACVTDIYNAQCARRHNNANVLCLGQRVLDLEKALLIVDAFLDEAFEGGRHARRVEKITKLDDSRCCAKEKE